MMSTMNSKRRRDDADDEEDSKYDRQEKRSRASGGNELLSPPLYSTSSTSVKDLPFPSPDSTSRHDDSSPDSTVSEVGSSNSDIDMVDDDMDMAFSTSPEQSALWTFQPSPPKLSKLGRLNGAADRVPTPIVTSINHPASNLMHSPRRTDHHSTTTKINRGHLGIVMERLPSPVDEDEPHTPTTAAGSQSSSLTVNDMDVDHGHPEPAVEPGPVIVRKQRARSGAFTTSTGDTTKKFSMGYREDCEKCRNRVPGHMNHFLGA